MWNCVRSESLLQLVASGPKAAIVIYFHTLCMSTCLITNTCTVVVSIAKITGSLLCDSSQRPIHLYSGHNTLGKILLSWRCPHFLSKINNEIVKDMFGTCYRSCSSDSGSPHTQRSHCVQDYASVSCMCAYMLCTHSEASFRTLESVAQWTKTGFNGIVKLDPNWFHWHTEARSKLFLFFLVCFLVALGTVKLDPSWFQWYRSKLVSMADHNSSNGTVRLDPMAQI